ncbi:MAG: flagellar export chaperone FlgN [Clostridia bacterium]|nr:flagellar export chaperone FlgN [Clostridia bacterium]
MNQNIVEYKTVLEECLVECKKMLDFESQKRKALLDSDVNNLTAVLQAQQATMMKLENIEKKRIAAQEKAGFGEMKADAIIEKIEDAAQKNSFTSTVNELRTIVEEIQSLNKISIDIAKSNLKIANTILQQQQADNTGVYTSSGANANWSSSSFEEKI